ncbi:hypothetical protein VTL71DRAFT_7624 [Oculimacula yallundae]|uniref:Cep57 centrosome microtubule-binding domain-containing protein n=1 Tax=Oculimacula yallundae TaxID=86028 RepID=A0ABR4BW64_9HELO
MSTAAADARQRRSRLIAEMSRNIKMNDHSIASSLNLKRSDRSFASSTGSKHGSVTGSVSSKHGSSQHGTISRDSTRSTDFDPERDEALVSTQRMDFDVSQKLPQLRDTARKYGQWQPRKQEDFKINTSAIGRAFPDFTQGDTELSLSIEQPRPHISKKQGFNDSPLAAVTNGMRLRGSPRAARPRSPILDALSRKEEKENIAPHSQKSAGSAYVSQASHTTDNPYRDPYDSIDNDTFSTLPLPPSPPKYQAHVDTDMSMSSFDDSLFGATPSKPNTSQPMVLKSSPLKTTTQAPDSNEVTADQSANSSQVSIDSQAGRSRKTSSARQSSSATVVRKTSAASQAGPSRQAASNKQAANINASANVAQASIPIPTAQPTQSSFIIPGPAVSEKVPAIAKPFTQQGKILTRRSRQRPVDGFKEDITEENIYEMIDTLRGKVADLEMVNKSTQETISGLRRDNDQLLSEKKQLEAANTDAQNTIKELQKKAADYDLVHGMHSQAKRVIVGLQTEVEDHKAINTDFNNTIEQLQAAIQTLSEENKIIKQEHEHIMQENQEFRAEHTRVGSEVKELLKQIESVAEENQLLTKENRERVKKNHKLAKENEQMAQENERLNATMSEAQDTITSLKNNMTQQDEMFTEKVTVMENNFEELKRKPHGMGRRRIPSDDADATMRPAQDPMEALKEVISRQEDKMKKLKEKLQEMQDAYMKHDPAMGRRARKELRAEIERLVKEIDRKGDRIYQLYDVKEGLY